MNSYCRGIHEGPAFMKGKSPNVVGSLVPRDVIQVPIGAPPLNDNVRDWSSLKRMRRERFDRNGRSHTSDGKQSLSMCLDEVIAYRTTIDTPPTLDSRERTLARVHEVLPDYEPLTARTAHPEPIEVTWDRITSPSTEPVDSPGSKWPDLRHGARSTVVCCSTAAIP